MKSFYCLAKESDGKISEVNFCRRKSTKIISSLEKECESQIEEYISRKRKSFSLPLQMSGTEFQKKIWKEMIKIPYGKTISYKELAQKIGKPKAYRAVANACGANKIPIIIPCHRVVASKGLGGYSSGIKIKQKLLQIEKNNTK